MSASKRAFAAPAALRFIHHLDGRVALSTMAFFIIGAIVSVSMLGLVAGSVLIALAVASLYVRPVRIGMTALVAFAGLALVLAVAASAQTTGVDVTSNAEWLTDLIIKIAGSCAAIVISALVYRYTGVQVDSTLLATAQNAFDLKAHSFVAQTLLKNGTLTIDTHNAGVNFLLGEANTNLQPLLKKLNLTSDRLNAMATGAVSKAINTALTPGMAVPATPAAQS